MLRLGAFELIEPLGTGGAAVAWRAMHRRGVPVAVKVLHARFADQEIAKRGFAQEIRALARLDHPAIAAVFDFGEVDAETARASDGELVAGVPWLALELGSTGSLADRALGPTTEEALAELVSTLLGALGHAHARGVLHRDLKPQNVVLRGPFDHRSGPMLVDFGLASFLGAPPEAGTESAGTHRFSSPEQLDGDWRAFGPWTDLYALGALTRTLVPGPVPDPWEAWIRRATALDPADRFADAAAARAALPGPRRRPRPWPRVPPILSTIGLPLLELRRPRLVGRRVEQRALLAAQRRVARSGRPEHVVLRGPPGVGRSALLQWLAERSNETGEAWVVPVVADAEGQVARPTLHRWLGFDPVERPERLDRWRHVLRPGARDTLQRASDDGTNALLTLLVSLAEHRPVLVTADPADDASALVRAVLRLSAPILVLTVGAGEPGLDVAPLSVRSLARVLDALLPLERSTLLRIAAEADGRVVHARQVLAGVVRSGALVERDQRWALAPDTTIAAASDDALPEGLVPTGAALFALGVAAALGPRVSIRQWERACDVPPGLLPSLLAAGLVEETPDGFEHLQPSFRRAVLSRIAREGLLARVHGRCADVRTPDTPRRRWLVGRDLRLAGRIEEAEPLLREAVTGLHAQDRYDLVLRALDELERCGAGDRWVRRQRLYALLHVGSHELAEVDAEALLAEARAEGDLEVASDAARVLGVVRIRSGRRAAGEEAARLAVALGRGTPIEANALLLLVDCLNPTRVDEAEVVAERMLSLATGSLRATATQRLARIAHLKGDRERARTLLHSVVGSPEADRVDVRQARVALGELAREDGDLDGAEKHYLAAIDGLGPFVEGGELLAVGLLNLAVVAIDRGEPSTARNRLDRLADACGALTRSLIPIVDVVTAACAAELGDLEELEVRLGRVAAGAEEPSLWQQDSVDLLVRCAAGARRVGREGLAGQAERIAAGIAGHLVR